MSSDLTTAPAQLSTEEARVVGAVPKQLFIAGRWVDSSSGETLEVLDPATGAVICSVADATPEDGMAALDAAVAAQAGFAAMSPRSRSDILMTAFRLMHERIDDLALLMTLEMGKPVAEAKGEITYAAEFFRHFAEEATRIDGGYLTAPAGNARLLVTKQPVGPTLLITPWNFPMAMGTRKLGPAIAAGCTSVIKPAHQTPLSMLALVEILREAGLPEGVVNVITCMHSNAVMEPLVRSGKARKLSFTGSTRVGKILLEQCADQVLRTSMELGGNAPFIVFEDANLDEAVNGAMLAKMRNMGEACTAANRIYVHESIIGEFGKRLSAAMAALPVGRGTVEGVRVGPLIDQAALDKVSELVADAVGKGATVLVGGLSRNGARGDLRPGRPAHPLLDRGGGHRRGQRQRVRPGLVRLHQRPAPGATRRRGARVRDGRDQPGHRLEPGCALRWDEAVRSGPRGRRGRHRRVPRDQVHRHLHVRMEL